MSTLSLDDLSANQRRALGLEACPCRRAEAIAMVAQIPIIETSAPERKRYAPDSRPGAAWLATGLHLLRAPPPRAGRPAA